jgi:hypothetical protein
VKRFTYHHSLASHSTILLGRSLSNRHDRNDRRRGASATPMLRERIGVVDAFGVLWERAESVEGEGVGG